MIHNESRVLCRILDPRITSRNIAIYEMSRPARGDAAMITAGTEGGAAVPRAWNRDPFG